MDHSLAIRDQVHNKVISLVLKDPSQVAKDLQELSQVTVMMEDTTKEIIQLFPVNPTLTIQYTPKFSKHHFAVKIKNILDITLMLMLDAKYSMFAQTIKLTISYAPMEQFSIKSTWFVFGGTNLIVVQLLLFIMLMQTYMTTRYLDLKDLLQNCLIVPWNILVKEHKTKAILAKKEYKDLALKDHLQATQAVELKGLQQVTQVVDHK